MRIKLELYTKVVLFQYICMFTGCNIFLCLGLESEWFWYEWRNGVKSYVDFMANNYRKCFTYPDFAPMFTTEFYNADEWAELISASGAK